jgi:putative phosphoesterase
MHEARPLSVGILSDTHRQGIDDAFTTQIKDAFSSCEVIIHAGDLTSRKILDAFGTLTVHAVHGNMCGYDTRKTLPDSLSFTIGGYRFGLCHGDGLGHDLESGLISRFENADCIVFGHTHQPLVQRFGSVLLINPGTFRGTGRHGSPGTYAILTIDDKGLSAAIHRLPVV